MPVKHINVYFEDGEDVENPTTVQENQSKIFNGYHFSGSGFLLTHEEADRLRASSPRNEDVIMPIINGEELNNDPSQAPGRSIINFRDWPIDEARGYPEPFSIVEEKVKPYRDTQNRKRNREVWWVYAEHRPGLTRAIRNLSHCFATARTTKHLSFSALPAEYVFSNALYVLATGRWDIFAMLQSTLHEVWARKYSGSLETRLRYSPSNCFDTFAFPAGLWEKEGRQLAHLGERYHAHRKTVMESLWLGLTKIYNLFHARDLSVELVARHSKKGCDVAAAGLDALQELRRLHVELDLAIRDAYGWHDLDLDHDFYEMEALPENDRIRYTISPDARREVLSRLLAENQARSQAKEGK